MQHPPQPDVSVVIPARDAGQTISSQLAALDRQTFDRPFEVVVADNGSRDDTPNKVSDWARARFELRCVNASGAASASRARNIGAAAARSDRLVFCDADDEVDKNWLHALVAAAPTAGTVVGGRVDEAFLNRGNRRLHFGDGDDLPVAWSFLRAAASCNLLVWRADFLRLGGFEESIPYPAEDTDFSWRAQLAGLELRYEPAAVVYYRHRQGNAGAIKQAVQYGVGAARLLDRYRAVPGVPSGVPLRVRASVLAGEVERSVKSGSAVPAASQLLYEAAFSCAKTYLALGKGRDATTAGSEPDSGGRSREAAAS